MTWTVSQAILGESMVAAAHLDHLAAELHEHLATGLERRGHLRRPGQSAERAAPGHAHAPEVGLQRIEKALARLLEADRRAVVRTRHRREHERGVAPPFAPSGRAR